jgi:UV DNA damage repair endonuclease
MCTCVVGRYAPSAFNKINIHIGGVYGDHGSKQDSMDSWAANFRKVRYCGLSLRTVLYVDNLICEEPNEVEMGMFGFQLSEGCRARMTVENDDVASAYSVEDLLYLHEKCVWVLA